VELLRTRVGASKGDKLCDDLLRKKMGETGLIKTVAHVDDQKTEYAWLPLWTVYYGPKYNREVERPKNRWPEGFKFGEVRSDLILGIIL
jgi:hypothetical protein